VKYLRLAPLVSFFALVGCAGADPAPPPITPAPPSPPVTASKPAPVAPEDQVAAEIQKELARVAEIRHLPVKHPVKNKVMERSALAAKIKAKVVEDIPADVIAGEGETLIAFELIPPDYDFLEGNLKMVEGQIAGLYIPEDKTIYVVDDLSDAEADETVAHELVHALQDQSFDIDKDLKFKLGESDRISAAHAVIEGDATVAMIDAAGTDSLSIDPSTLARMMAMGSAMSGGGVPPVLLASLVAPYSDGFAFIQSLRKKGGWDAVNKAYSKLPQTTEQLLHPDKYEAHEPRLVLPEIDPTPLGSGFHSRLADDQGEQGLRIMLAAWSTPNEAAEAAAGWGGDRVLLAESKAQTKNLLATAFHLRFDAPKLADKMTAILKKKFPVACRERKDLGPFAWKRQGADIVIVGGPYARDVATGKKVTSAGTCADANRWIEAILKAK
jgi:hypothetical protein